MRFQSRWRKPAAVLGVSLVCTVFLITCGDDDDDVAQGEFLALSYNVAGLPQGISGSNPVVNTPLIGPLLNDYDLVLMQETWQTPDPNPLAPTRVYHEILDAASEHPYKSESMPLPLNGNPERPTAIVSDGLNRFSRFPFGEITRQRWAGCDDSAADCLSLKGFSVARTEFAPGVCVDVYNLHGEAGSTDNDFDLRDQNTRDLLDFMDEYSAGRAVIVGGDFNMRLRRERDAVNLLLLEEEGGLTDACLALDIVDTEAIDKFFFRSNDRVTIAPSTCGFEIDVFVDPQGEPLSDHDALAVRFEWVASPDPRLDCL